MNLPRRYHAQHGQAALEAFLAVALLAACLHGLATIGALQHRVLQAAHLGRHAAFAAARGQLRQATIPPDATVSVARSANDGLGWGPDDPQAAVLSQDWLRVDRRLLRAQATVGPGRAVAFAQRNGPAARLAIRRYTSLAVGAGHAAGDLATQQRLAMSEAGWSGAARGTVAAAQSLHGRMRAVDAPWGRGKWSLDWLSAWADLVPAYPRGTEH
ncbi:hypothetical protein [Bordetella petrii]|uniref:hypothetical protein n=1 Tax=Bordetella petrii TaxID=94624 RepID=UPI0037341B66